MKTQHTRILFGAAFGLAVVLVARGQTVIQPPPAGEPSPPRVAVPQELPDAKNTENQPATITVEHRGRLLVLNYGPQPGSGGLMTNSGPRGEPPGFVIFKGQRPIITGQFEYG